MEKECPRCELKDYKRTKREDGIRHKATVEQPSIEELEDMSNDGECETTDGCYVEPDGICEHGHQSWVVALGLI